MKYILTFLTLFFLTFGQQDISAAKKTKKKSASHIPIASSLVVDASNGRILHSEGAYKQIFPASLTKVMTAYLTFAALEDGKIKMTDHVTVSREAASMLPSKIGLKPGSKVMIKDALMAVIVKSANDMAVVLAETIEGDHKKFVNKMNLYAKKLGMSNTNFTNASGWHHADQKSTAIDMAKLAIAIRRDFPKYYPLFAETEFRINGTLYKGHNRIAEFYPGADGLKTGFHCPAGFNIISTATKKGRSLIAVVTGGHTASARDRKVIHLLDKHFGEKSNITYPKLAEKHVAIKNKLSPTSQRNIKKMKKKKKA